MKTLLLSLPLTLAAGLLAMPAAKADIDAELYAKSYCSLRDFGVEAQESRRLAMEKAYIHGDSPEVVVYGIRTNTAVVQAARAVSRICPQYLGK